MNKNIRIFFILSIFLFVFSFLTARKTFAQVPTNTFSCQFQPGFGCVVGINDCNPGFEPNEQQCSTISDEFTCNGTAGLSCQDTNPGQCYTCVSGVCQGSPTGPYCGPDGFQNCQDNCSSFIPTNFRCDPITGCIEDTGGPFSTIGECESSCQADPDASPEATISIIKPESCDCKGVISQECVDQGNTPAECTRQVCGIRTMIGCVPTDPGSIPGWLFTLSLPIAGAAAFALMLYGAFLILTSSGNPDRLKEGQEILFSALAGLLLIIFSVFTMRLVGVTILKIPGFG